VARKSNGAVLTNFSWGKAKIYTFKDPVRALNFIEDLNLNGKPALLRLLNINYQSLNQLQKYYPHFQDTMKHHLLL